MCGVRHPGLDSRAALCLKQQKLEDAEEVYKRSLSIKEGYYGENNIETAKAMHNLAKVYDAQGECRKALPLYQRIAAVTSTVGAPSSLTKTAVETPDAMDCLEAQPAHGGESDFTPLVGRHSVLR